MSESLLNRVVNEVTQKLNQITFKDSTESVTSRQNLLVYLEEKNRMLETEDCLVSEDDEVLLRKSNSLMAEIEKRFKQPLYVQFANEEHQVPIQGALESVYAIRQLRNAYTYLVPSTEQFQFAEKVLQCLEERNAFLDQCRVYVQRIQDKVCSAYEMLEQKKIKRAKIEKDEYKQVLDLAQTLDWNIREQFKNNVPFETKDIWFSNPDVCLVVPQEIYERDIYYAQRIAYLQIKKRRFLENDLSTTELKDIWECATYITKPLLAYETYFERITNGQTRNISVKPANCQEIDKLKTSDVCIWGRTIVSPYKTV